MKKISSGAWYIEFNSSLAIKTTRTGNRKWFGKVCFLTHRNVAGVELPIIQEPWLGDEIDHFETEQETREQCVADLTQWLILEGFKQ